MSERTKTITEDMKVYDCDVCKKEAEHNMLCRACHRDFCEEHQEGGGPVADGARGVTRGWFCPECLPGAEAIYRRNNQLREAVQREAQRNWETFGIEQQAKHWPE